MKPEKPTLSICQSSDGKYRLIGSIYMEDPDLHKQSCNGFDSYHEASEARKRCGYFPFNEIVIDASL